ncbi:(2Fe-2S)-binding protein [Euzebya tangerina]|uniref:(2Fe-2S)-binding protein n=1 Tax=Euzebya tangerina TaxID=591198 RepID=UPI000E30FDB4|nr:(2Fe-2S)-binding protein [Euzebya tangerina]
MSDSTPPDAPEAAQPYALTVNGEDVHVDSSWIGESLLHVLRDRLSFAGTKNACDQGECGSCTVIMDGQPVVSCCVMAADAVGAELITIEALDGTSDVQQAFLSAGAVQCGFCTPGLILATHDLLDRDPEADDLTIREALSGNLCRCTGYGRILQAVRTVRDDRLNAGGTATSQGGSSIGGTGR